jgi:hypothetical protein
MLAGSALYSIVFQNATPAKTALKWAARPGWLLYAMCASRQHAAGVRAPVSAASAVRHGTAR